MVDTPSELVEIQTLRSRVQELERALEWTRWDVRDLKSIYKHRGDRTNAAVMHSHLLEIDRVLYPTHTPVSKRDAET